MEVSNKKKIHYILPIITLLLSVYGSFMSLRDRDTTWVIISLLICGISLISIFTKKWKIYITLNVLLGIALVLIAIMLGLAYSFGKMH